MLQYHRPAEQDGMVLAFRRRESPYYGLAVELHDLDPAAIYEVVRSASYEPAAPCVSAAANSSDCEAC